MFPQKPSGKIYSARKLVTLGYLMVFFGLPFIKVNGHPVFLLNVLERKFILFGQIFWPQDFFIFALGMILFIVFIRRISQWYSDGCFAAGLVRRQSLWK